MRRCIPSPHGPSAHGPCMVRRRRITTACFLDVIRAPCGGARVQDEAREEATVRRRAREGMAAPGATGLPTAWKRTESPVPPRRCRCRRDARRCRWPGSGSASSKGTTAGSTSRGRRACGPRSLSAAISTAHFRSNGLEGTVDEIPSTLRSDPAGAIGDTAAPPRRPGSRIVRDMFQLAADMVQSSYRRRRRRGGARSSTDGSSGRVLLADAFDRWVGGGLGSLRARRLDGRAKCVRGVAACGGS